MVVVSLKKDPCLPTPLVVCVKGRSKGQGKWEGKEEGGDNVGEKKRSMVSGTAMKSWRHGQASSCPCRGMTFLGLEIPLSYSTWLMRAGHGGGDPGHLHADPSRGGRGAEVMETENPPRSGVALLEPRRARARRVRPRAMTW